MTLPSLPTEPVHLVAICGGAVAGSEAAALCAERGVTAIVLEQNARPYGKIEDGLPRWHRALRRKEYDRIDANLRRDRVIYVPSTRLGQDVTLHELTGGPRVSALILANGAWRDRRLPVEGIDAYVGKGLLYQNPFVYWFNHYPEAGYAGPRYEAPDGALVVGGGLASIDVVKILALEAYRRALAARGIDAGVEELEHRGIAHFLQGRAIDPADLGVEGPTLLYRRRKKDMPLASAPPGASPERLAKIEAARERIVDKVIRDYFVKLEPCVTPVGALVEGDRLVGLRLQRTRIEGRRVIPIEGTEHERRAPLVVSSIGSVPEALEGVPLQGELFRYRDWSTGELEGLPGVYGLGNVLTGKGNIKESRKSAQEVMGGVLETYLGVAASTESADEVVDVLHEQARDHVEGAVEQALNGPRVAPEDSRRIFDLVRRRWEATGYDGDYDRWMAKVGRSD